MTYERKNGLTSAEKAELWARFKRGQTFVAIARALNRRVSSIYSIVREHGGIIPPVRRRASRTLTLTDRAAISRGLSAGASVRRIAASLDRAPSTIRREITRNGGSDRYRAVAADVRAWRAARRPKASCLERHPRRHRLVVAKLRANWSPAQIAGWLVVTYPSDPSWHVSHETIYRSRFLQARGALRRELTAHWRTRRPMRRSKHATTASELRGRLIGAVSITDRPPSIEDRAVPGHWAGDLISGAKNTHIATLVERTSRYVQLVRVAGKDTTSVISA